MTDFRSAGAHRIVVDFRVRLPHDHRPTVELPASAERYDQLLGLSASITRTSNDLENDLDTAAVTGIIVHAEYEHGDIADSLNEAVAAFRDEQRRVLTGFGTVSLDSASVTRMVRQVRRAAALRLRGINLQPCFFGRAIDDRELYPVYATAQEEGLVVAVHTGIGYNTSRPIDGEQPFRLDRIACAFPGLPLVACHAGWPWATELAAVMRKHPNIYADFGGMSPRYLAQPGTGWETLYRYANSLLQDQVLFASDWPAFDPGRAAQEWSQMSVKPAVLAKLFSENVFRLIADAPP